ncbi:UvrD-helicase domain-containing protein [Salinivirga cyanobacteriivorans]
MSYEHSNSGLNIIKASAGSGKTHRLTFEYIKLVLGNPSLFKNILAVTFTNKATAEMKLRIVDELTKIAKLDPDGKMMPDLKDAMQVSGHELSKRAQQVLEFILHEYGHFSVSTIDQFFQGIVRALTRELNLSGGYRVQIDQREIIENAVEHFLADLKNNEAYMKLMLDFVDARMSDDKSWNVQNELNKFTVQLFREHVRFYFIRNRGSLTGQKSPAEVRKLLRNAINKFEARIKTWTEKGQAFLSETGIEQQDLIGKSKNAFHLALQKAEKKDYDDLPTRLERLQSVEKWLHKSSEKQALANTVDSFITEFTYELESIIKNEYVEYIEATALFRNIFQHSLASGLMQKVTDYLADQNLFMLSDAPVLLNLFTDNSDTPFIYEKTGHRFKHYMIDEFQDTSALQWANFKPLIEESVASIGYGNFIVGDVKQAIYRWRNGDWNLLQRVVAKQIPDHTVHSLQQNWRSKEKVVKFNNTFFSNLIPFLSGQQEAPYSDILSEMYDDVQQVIPENVAEDRSGGYVELRGLAGAKVDDFKDNALIALKEQVDRLMIEHKQKGVCILVRKNAEVKKVATYLINETNYNVISTGSMTLANSRLLQHLITTFKYLVEPHDLYLKTLAAIYNYDNNKVNFNDVFLGAPEKYLPDEFIERQPELANSSSLALIGKIINIFKLDEKFPGQDVFISRFYNEVKKLAGENGGGLLPVIDWWDREGSELSIEVNETDEESVTVMTIHKSKGLQFRHVILPFLYGYPDKKLDMMWVDGSAFSFEALKEGLFPIILSQKHVHSKGLNFYYQKELFELMVDQINTLYVAMTRPKESLTIFYNKEAGKNEDAAFWFNRFLNQENEQNKLLVGRSEQDDIFTFGELISSDGVQKTKPAAINIRLDDVVSLNLKTDYQHISTQPHEKLMASKGSLLHKIFEKIILPDDIPKAIDEKIQQGFLDKAEREPMLEKINKWVRQPGVAHWFTETVKVLTEADIIVPNKSSSRPDRLIFDGEKVMVVDYKFGAHKRAEHHKQVIDYCKIMRDMGYQNVEGYVWYPVLGAVHSVKI